MPRGLLFQRLRRVMTRKRMGAGLAGFAALWMGMCGYGLVRPLPDGVSVEGALHATPNLEFLYDLTYHRDTTTVVEQQLFERVYALIDDAERFVYVDMFLFNGEHAGDRDYIPLAQQLTTALIAKKSATPGVDIVFATDEINNFYGAYTSNEIQKLRDAGITVAVTDLTKLRDSNPIYSSAWRLFIRWFGTGGVGLFPHPLTSRGQKVTARSYLKLFNLKANHRKVIVTDRGCLVASANPHDASSFHSNIAWTATGGVCQDMLDSERGIAAFSGVEMAPATVEVVAAQPDETAARAQFLSEGKIAQHLLAVLSETTVGDSIDMAMFYLSDRGVVNALVDAANRGVSVRVVLDPNKDAFGREKGGIPNRQVAYEMQRRTDEVVAVRWYDTRGEQFHTKLVLIWKRDRVVAFGGSANLTRRNLRDFNLEANLKVVAAREDPLAGELDSYFERIWSNEDGHFTVAFDVYRDTSFFKRLLYRIQEFTGLCSY